MTLIEARLSLRGGLISWSSCCFAPDEPSFLRDVWRNVKCDISRQLDLSPFLIEHLFPHECMWKKLDWFPHELRNNIQTRKHRDKWGILRFPNKYWVKTGTSRLMYRTGMFYCIVFEKVVQVSGQDFHIIILLIVSLDKIFMRLTKWKRDLATTGPAKILL